MSPAISARAADPGRRPDRHWPQRRLAGLEMDGGLGGVVRALARVEATAAAPRSYEIRATR